ncbi:sphingomyelin phosphodiesterase-like [Anopheles darlingi]|uniref:sphingomyelin phosphodiesterase-like n=1 Tax=Anopheles darlingi TaxID=43151 RepID=UPI00210045E1|nr:sphingomyelin phosphodiesterase-like [Anopheles darlingi]
MRRYCSPAHSVQIGYWRLGERKVSREGDIMRSQTVLALVAVVVALCCTQTDADRLRPQGYKRMVERWQKYYVEFEAEVGREFRAWKRDGVMSTRFRELIDSVRISPEERGYELRELPTAREGPFCGICRGFGGSLLEFRREGATREEVFETAAELCAMLDLQAPDICRGLIDLNIDPILYIIDNRPELPIGSVCAVVFQSGACDLNDENFSSWSVDIDPNGTPVTASKSGTAQRGPNDLKIVQITDLHFDPNYRTGYNADCGAPACCRESQGIPENPAAGAGPWGDYRACDTPWNAVEDIIDRAAEDHPDADFIYHTGDIIDHGIWETSIGYNVRSINQVIQKLRTSFPDKPVYNILGNHEAHPTNVYELGEISRPDFSTNWLYHLSADLWSAWLPRATEQTIRLGGYYTALVRPGFRVIALNNNDCYTFNWWILYQPDALRNQLQWLHDVLLQAERAGEKVHILSHLPVSSDCFSVWQREYRRVLERFRDTVSAQFHGHTHKDEFNVFYAAEDPQYAVAVAWNGGSGTAHTNVNPNYVVYYVNPETYEVTDFESYAYNLTAANLEPNQRPEWFRMYSFQEEFGLSDLSPAGIDELIQRLGTPDGREELQRYWEYKVKLADASLAIGCDENCLLNHLCEIVSNQADDNRKCQELSDAFFG